MRNFIYTMILSALCIFGASAQNGYLDDEKVSRREKKFITRNYGLKDKDSKRKQKREARKQKKLERYAKKVNKERMKDVTQKRKNWGTKQSRKEQARHYKSMKKQNMWFSRDHPRKHQKETNYP